jgi:transglutaminase-like putative cysteine protease
MLCLCVLSSVFASELYQTPGTIETVAKTLKGSSDIVTVVNVQNYAEKNIEYQFYYHARGISKTWKEKKGDCTDKAMLECKMLQVLGIKCRLVHGYVDNRVKHDWIEYKINNSWQSNECEYFTRCKKIGNGIW